MFSNSVADALFYCKTKQVVGFNYCESTITFCRITNDLFDFLNKLKYKRPLYIEQDKDIQKFIHSSISYLESLKDRNHLSILTSPRKTGFIGLIVCLKSMGRLFNNVVKTGQLSFI